MLHVASRSVSCRPLGAGNNLKIMFENGAFGGFLVKWNVIFVR